MKRAQQTVDGMPIVRKESDAYAVYDVDAREVVAYAPGMPWPLRKSKWLRENGTGHKVVYVGFPENLNCPTGRR